VEILARYLLYLYLEKLRGFEHIEGLLS